MDRNYQKVDKKILRVLKCKKIVGLRDFLYKVCAIRLLKVCYHRYLEFGNYFFSQLEPTFLANFYACNGQPLFRLLETSLFYLMAHLWLENMWHTFQESETKIRK